MRVGIPAVLRACVNMGVVVYTKRVFIYLIPYWSMFVSECVYN